MEREKLESLLIDFIDGRLAEGERQQVRDLLKSDPEAQVLYEQLKEVTTAMDQSAQMNPSDKLFRNFQDMLRQEEELQKKPAGKQVFMSPMMLRAAAGVILVLLGVIIGNWYSDNQKHKAELEALRKEMQNTKELMLALVNNQQSASQRMQGMNVALTITQVDDEIVNALVKSMNSDPNSNVRLAALDALSKFSEQPHVRKALVESMEIQNDPVVQIELIQLMVKMKEKGIVDELNKIINDDKTIKPVKDEAYSGLLKLS